MLFWGVAFSNNLLTYLEIFFFFNRKLQNISLKNAGDSAVSSVISPYSCKKGSMFLRLAKLAVVFIFDQKKDNLLGELHATRIHIQ